MEPGLELTVVVVSHLQCKHRFAANACKRVWHHKSRYNGLGSRRIMSGATKPSLSIGSKRLVLSIAVFAILQAVLSRSPLLRFSLKPVRCNSLTLEQNYQPRSYQGRLEADDGQWTRPAKDYASTRYSSLDQINAKNAKDLKLAFTFSTGMTHGHEAAPLVVNNTMYIVTPVPEQPVRPRPNEAGRSDEVGVRARAHARIARSSVL